MPLEATIILSTGQGSESTVVPCGDGTRMAPVTYLMREEAIWLF